MTVWGERGPRRECQPAGGEQVIHRPKVSEYREEKAPVDLFPRSSGGRRLGLSSKGSLAARGRPPAARDHPLGARGPPLWRAVLGE